MKNLKNIVNTFIIISLFSMLTITYEAECFDNEHHSHKHANQQTISSLPVAAQNFIKQHFTSNKITYIRQDNRDTDFEVWLDNDTKIDFEANGIWDNVEGHVELPTSLIALLPEQAKDYIDKKYPDAIAIEIDNGSRSWDNWDVKIKTKDSTYRDLEFNKSGKILEDEYDD